jgi:predicted P-loop ATPase
LLAYRPEYDGGEWTDLLTAAALEWFETHDVATTKEVLEAAVDRLAKAHAYHPVKEYLEALATRRR